MSPVGTTVISQGREPLGEGRISILSPVGATEIAVAGCRPYGAQQRLGAEFQGLTPLAKHRRRSAADHVSIHEVVSTAAPELSAIVPDPSAPAV